MNRLRLAAVAAAAVVLAGTALAVHQSAAAAPRLRPAGAAFDRVDIARRAADAAARRAGGSPTAPASPEPTPTDRPDPTPTASPSTPPGPGSPPTTTPSAGPSRPRMLVLAHRGGVERARENTMASFNDAISIHADYVETDVRHSSDGVAFLLHDPTLPGACAPYRGQDFRTLTAAQVATVRCGGQPIPRLAELVERLRRPDAQHVAIMAEVKDVDPLGIRDALAPLGWDRVLVQSFDFNALREIEQASPQVHTCPLIWVAGDLPGALSITHDCVGPDFHAVDANFVATAHAAGAVIYSFTVDDPAIMTNLAALGADGIITNKPRLAFSVLK
jgi:glycerophosphoryl diester phosphodiesterase